MKSAVSGLTFEPFFLDALPGKRFCIFHPAVGKSLGAVVYIHPFAEEMNKSRHMAALQAQALAAAGYSVLQIDLFGCGDSSGDFSEARWEIWQRDVALGTQWLSARAGGRVALWGLRLGAVLALDAARLCHPAPERFLLWQPVLSGEALLTQFLRMRLASEMLSEGRAKTGVTDLRVQLAAGRTTEIAGYALAPELAACMDKLRLADLAPPFGNVHWLEVIPGSARMLPPASSRVADSWNLDRNRLGTQCVQGPSFWNTVEITECPDLISATTSVMLGASA